MYYISAITGKLYYVTDTKDGITEPYDYAQIYDFVENMGLFIRGVENVGPQLRISVYKNVVKPTELAYAFTTLDKSMLSMGDSYSDIAENLCCLTKHMNDMAFYGLDVDCLTDLCAEAYQILIDRKDKYLHEIISYLLNEEYCNYEMVNDEMFSECVSSIRDSEIYKATYLVYKFCQDFDKKLAKGIKEKMLDRMKNDGVASIRVGYAVGHEYFRYLDSKIFGTITNCVFTVGHALTVSDKQEFKELKPYSYMHCKGFNGLSPRPEVFIAYLYRNGENGTVIVDVKLGRSGYVGKSVISTVGYIKDVGSFTLDVNNPDNSKIVADHCNKLAVKVRKFAEANESLLHLLPQGAKVEKF